jgi:ABC-type nitrate/sulfonate/bicarbonate transport system ATPase subunit
MRAALAAALFVTPDLLLLDEVLCHLDCCLFCGLLLISGVIEVLSYR